MVRMRARIAEDEEPRVGARQARTRSSRSTSPTPRSGRFVEPRLAHLLGARRGQRCEREDLFAAWRLFFERLADVVPGRDRVRGHAVGGRVAARLHRVPARVVAQHPIFVLTLARPELLERRPTWGAGKRNFTSLYLEPLSPRRWRSCSPASSPGCPTSCATQILARAEGVPLYAVETVRMLLDRGAARPGGRARRPARARRRGARDAARADRRAPRRPGPRSGGGPGCRGARQDVHEAGARRADGLRSRLRAARSPRSSRREVLGLRPIPVRPSSVSTASSRTSRQVAYETLAQADEDATYRGRRLLDSRGEGRPAASCLDPARPAQQEVVELEASQYLAAASAASGAAS